MVIVRGVSARHARSAATTYNEVVENSIRREKSFTFDVISKAKFKGTATVIYFISFKDIILFHLNV